MKFVLYKWGGFNEDILEKNLMKMGHDVFEFVQACVDYNMDINLATKLMEMIRNCRAEAVISFNFFPIIAVACNAVGINYYSWVYDSPHTTLYSNAVKYDTNIIGVFDRSLVDEINAKGVKTIFHVPLAVDPEELGRRIIKFSRQKTKRLNRSDISFVGSLYTDKNTYYDKYKDQDFKQINSSENRKKWEYLDEIIAKQMFDYKADYINDPSQDYRLLEKKMYDDDIDLGKDYFATQRDNVIKSVMERKVTIEERRILFETIGARLRYSFDLYTASNTDGLLCDVMNRGKLDYNNEMPWVFANSRINLNITLRSIKSGIPLRALDIVGCGGFLLSNYQNELEENFIKGSEIEMYCSLEECLEKMDYYLEHEQARNNIARKGKEKVTKAFSYKEMIGRLTKSSVR